MKDVIEKYSVVEYLEVLPEGSREAAMRVETAGADLNIFLNALAQEPGSGLATKGGNLWPSDLLSRLVAEVRALLCTDDPRYEDLRKKIRIEGLTSARVLVMLISNAVGLYLNVATALCVPLVALLLAISVKAGAEAWCKAIAENPQATLPDEQVGQKALPPESPHN